MDDAVSRRTDKRGRFDDRSSQKILMDLEVRAESNRQDWPGRALVATKSITRLRTEAILMVEFPRLQAQGDLGLRFLNQTDAAVSSVVLLLWYSSAGTFGAAVWVGRKALVAASVLDAGAAHCGEVGGLHPEARLASEGPMTPDAFSILAARAGHGVVTYPILDAVQFRFGGRAFATLGWPAVGWAVIKLDPHDQDWALSLSEGLALEPGGRRRAGVVLARLTAVDDDIVELVLSAAWRQAAQRKSARRTLSSFSGRREAGGVSRTAPKREPAQPSCQKLQREDAVPWRRARPAAEPEPRPAVSGLEVGDGHAEQAHADAERIDRPDKLLTDLSQGGRISDHGRQGAAAGGLLEVGVLDLQP